MILSIMQPYLFPYIGYFQLIASSDIFVIYDNIKYTKKGWINRNRILVNGQDATFSLPIKKDSDYLDISEREIAKSFNPQKLLNQFEGAYRSAPYFKAVYPILRKIIENKEENLFFYLHTSIKEICEYLKINTKILISSEIDIDHSLKKEDRIIAICNKLEAKTYINPIGGVDLYSKEYFKSEGIDLQFIKSKYFEYDQFNENFVPFLSIVDVLMFNSVESIGEMIKTQIELE